MYGKRFPMPTRKAAFDPQVTGEIVKKGRS